MKDFLAVVGLLFVLWCCVHYGAGLSGTELAHIVGAWLGGL